MKFYGREKQRKQIHKMTASVDQMVALIYGRLRIGKSELIKQCLIYYDDPVHKKNGEFDIVTKYENGYIFYEAKFRKEPLTEQMIEREIEQIRESGLASYRYGFISRSGFLREERPELILIDLQELYA